MNFSFIPCALFSLLTIMSAIWWIIVTPNKPESYLRLIILWRSFLIVLSHYRDIPSTTPIVSPDLRTTIECWLVVSSTILLDSFTPLDRLFATIPNPLIMIDFCILPFLAGIILTSAVILTIFKDVVN